ncbi:diacylglycerol/lipid kinase family protein [Piscibacillus halophilus]|uniref:diacylglycerol/lipid kinase family protein n=1 Tax=Piscibacillus halophilus TaxID=571933 RepID=UPI001FE6E851|nr:diacylglycerol kinase family protein [Piscibacillus halophilus]
MNTLYSLIVNKASGSGRGYKIWRQIETTLQNKSLSYQVSFTEYPHHATELVKEIIDQYNPKAIIVIGGDGTVHEVIQGLAGTNLPLGVIPSGSGNDFCRGMEIPLQHKKALHRILEHNEKVIDVGVINGKHFMTVVGVGFDGQVAKETNSSQNKKILNAFGLGKLTYVLNVLKVLFYYQPTHIDVEIDSKKMRYENVWLIATANFPCYAGGMVICPEAQYQDELLDICIVKDISRWKLLKVFPSVFKGKHIHHPSIKILKGKEIKISSTSPLVGHGDGEVIGETPFQIAVKPSSIVVL